MVFLKELCCVVFFFVFNDILKKVRYFIMNSRLETAALQKKKLQLLSSSLLITALCDSCDEEKDDEPKNSPLSSKISCDSILNSIKKMEKSNNARFQLQQQKFWRHAFDKRSNKSDLDIISKYGAVIYKKFRHIGNTVHTQTSYFVIFGMTMVSFCVTRYEICRHMARRYDTVHIGLT